MLRIILPIIAILILVSPETLGISATSGLIMTDYARALMVSLLLLPVISRITGLR